MVVDLFEAFLVDVGVGMGCVVVLVLVVVGDVVVSVIGVRMSVGGLTGVLMFVGVRGLVGVVVSHDRSFVLGGIDSVDRI